MSIIADKKRLASWRKYNATPKRVAAQKARAATPEAKAKRIASNKRYRQFKRDLLLQFHCRSCSHSDPCVVQWHHIDSSQKSFEIMSSLNTSHDKWWNEVLKCVPLCANCHVKIHKELLCLLPIHL